MQAVAKFVSTFGVVFVAELPDKTALAALALATRHRPAAVLLGAGTALTLQSVVAVAAGQALSLLPARLVHAVAGGLFIASAVLMWRRGLGGEASSPPSAGAPRFWRSTWLVFAVVFVAEWGDLTQLATAALAARYHAPWIVFGASSLALWSVAAIAVYVGHRAGRLVDPRVTARVAAGLFALAGAALLIGRF